MFDSAATELIKKNPFFLKCSVLGCSGFIFWMFVEVSCPARRQTSHCFPAEALPCCCEAHPAGAGSVVLLWTLPCPEAESLCCSGLSRQWQAASAVGVYLSRDGLPWQWLTVSVVGVYLSRDGLPR